MDLFEHQGKELFGRHGIPLVEGAVAASAGDARDAAARLGGHVAVKVQVQAGGRGKGGGVALVESADAAGETAARMFDEGFRGTPVTSVLVEALADVKEQIYASITLDRSSGVYVAIVSNEGGVEIEEVARENPAALRKVRIDPLIGLMSYELRRLTGHLPEALQDGTAEVVTKLWELLVETEATLAEINPLVLLSDGRVVALDAKVTIDDNALFRHPDLAALQKTFPVDPIEAKAKKLGLQYVALDGEVGIIGNGAGLVMSTLDLVDLAGGRAANFLDVGGGASAEMMSTSLEVILSDPKVRSVLINIFGGITRCDVVAQGIIEALRRIDARVPLVVRLDGTNAEEGRRIIAEADHERIVPAQTMLEAAEVAARLAKGAP